MIYFTSDQHFFDENIIHFCNRPFKNADDMKKELIRRHNEVVNPKDTVYHIGDFANLGIYDIKLLRSILKELNGNHHLILGNHDEYPAQSYVKIGFQTVHTSLFVEEFLLTHDPAVANCVPRSQSVICGHLHNLTMWVGDNVFNVSCDLWLYTPISIFEVRMHFETREKRMERGFLG